ncbi:uncharacterized protein LOC118433986 [Folsomia candida]|uniref:uncharacterized protein LOC118433986 n=1 Tax=Folsomia candida TaxID=158441 RepID=UPI001605489A|nr:uncharacterized protein LOC118433986 [Folsomia candida]
MEGSDQTSVTPEKLQPEECMARKILKFTDDEAISYATTRENVISVMNGIHRDRIDMKIVLQQLGKTDYMILSSPETHFADPTYDESMGVELKMENCVSIDTLVKNVGQILKGKFLLCRTITASSKMQGVDAGVEDLEGEKVMRLALNNYSIDAKMVKSDFEAVLPLGTVLIVKNPVFKKPFPQMPSFGLVVDNPADVELLSPKRMEALFSGVHWKSDLPQESRALFDSPLVWEFPPGQSDLETATKLKNVGNKAFVENRATDAIRFYDVALEYLPGFEEEMTPAALTLVVDILSNKAACLIKLECFNPALICTGKVLEINNAHVKAIYRHAKALIGLGRYAEGGKFLDEKLNEYPSLGEESKDILRLRSLIPELGKPPGKELICGVRRPPPRTSAGPQPPLPVELVDRISEFRGPVEIGKSSFAEGEGLFATQDLEPGTILLVGKPFAGVYVDPQEKPTFSLNTVTHEYLVGVMANKIRLDPDLGRDIYKLWAGPDLKSLTDNDVNITKVDIARIRNICNINYRGRNSDRAATFISCGVWIPPSKINHSCIDVNVMYHHHDISLIMMVTTFKKVKKGEEILASYIEALEPLERKKCMEIMRCVCKCRLCELDRTHIVPKLNPATWWQSPNWKVFLLPRPT